MNEKLKKCPFCGNNAFVGKWIMSSYWSIGCEYCFCIFENYFKTKKDAIKAWNKRFL